MSGIRVREYQHGDESEIVNLLDEAFGGWTKADLTCSKVDYWKWKHLEAPSSKKVVAVATHGGRIIGVLSDIVNPMQLGGKSITGNCASDFAVKQEFRNQGIGKRLVEKIWEIRHREGIRFIYCVTQNPILIRSYDEKYPRFPATVLNLVRIKDIDLQLKHMPMDNPWITKIGYHALSLANKLSHRTEEPIVEIEVKQVREFPKSISEVVKSNSHYRFLVNGGADYLNWRYSDTRSGPHKIMIAYHEGKPVGYIVTRVNRYRQAYPIAYVMDLLANPDRPDVADALLEYALKNLDSDNINLIISMTPKGHPYERIYSKHGFIDSRKNLNLYLDISGKDMKKSIEGIAPWETHFGYGSIDSLPVSIPKA